MATPNENLPEGVIDSLKVSPEPWARHREIAIRKIHNDFELWDLWPFANIPGDEEHLAFLVEVVQFFEERFYALSKNEEDYTQKMAPILVALKKRKEVLWNMVWGLVQPSVPFVLRMWKSSTVDRIEQDVMWKSRIGLPTHKILKVTSELTKILQKVKATRAPREAWLLSFRYPSAKRAYEEFKAMHMERKIFNESITEVDYVRRITLQLLLLEMKSEWIDEATDPSQLKLPNLPSSPSGSP